MINRIAVILALTLTACSQGPSLGRASDVVITARHDSGEHSAGMCERFNPTAADVERFLNAAIILDPYEWHHEFYAGPCGVNGTARFRGVEGKWSMNVLGTGSIAIYEDVYLIGIEKSRDCGDC